MPLATVLRVSAGLRAVFGSPTYKPPMLPSVALEIHDLSCRSDIDTEKLVVVLEHDPMLAAHVLRVANSPIFRGRDAESSLRSAVLRLGLKNLGEVVFEIALHMRVFRSAEYSGMMEQLRRHSTACGNLCRLLASRVGQDSEHAFLCGLLHDIGIAAILIVLGERRKSESALDPVVLSEVVGQIHEDVSGMLVRQWKLPEEVAAVVAHHHGQAAVTTAPLLSAVVAVADALATRFGFPMDLGARRRGAQAQARAWHGRSPSAYQGDEVVRRAIGACAGRGQGYFVGAQARAVVVRADVAGGKALVRVNPR